MVDGKLLGKEDSGYDIFLAEILLPRSIYIFGRSRVILRGNGRNWRESSTLVSVDIDAII